MKHDTLVHVRVPHTEARLWGLEVGPEVHAAWTER